MESYIQDFNKPELLGGGHFPLILYRLGTV